MKSTRLLKIVAALLILALPLWLRNEYMLHIAISIGIYIMLALSLNTIVGYAGQFALGHAAFYGIGSYVTALLLLNTDLSFWLVLPIAGLVTGLFGFILGSPVIRLRGDYLGIVTLGFGEIIRLIFVNWVDVTRGPMGLPGIRSPELFGYTFTSSADFYYLVLVLVAITVLVIYRVVHSGMGLSLLTVREDEVVAESIGIRPTKYKLIAFTMGALFAGVAGAFYATYISFISPDSFLYTDSVMILAMVVLGGMASVTGSILGAIVLVVTPELLRFASDYRMMLVGLAIVLMMVFKPQGFWGESRRKRNFYGKELADKPQKSAAAVSDSNSAT
ncbi:branched-chain amino acid ABC transporter permease [Brevibacillus massiliensis]|uniref:branched-chain amino acid ABC transporter permease n=1 Tax=Brevibacillus massiliensis TaxID=1118054 RepID=UPI00031277A9|nr:branched-chain amino acid ABC transporter permease [Brevibacillus massiliensis]